MAASPPLADRPFDAVAVRALLRRLAVHGEAPWLHREVARRMGERLALIRLQPTTVVDWWSGIGGGASVLAAAYPKARRLAIEPDARWLDKTRAANGAPWWSPARFRRNRVEATTESDFQESGVGLVWSNMTLHLEADPPALFERWERTLGAEGFVMFSCPGPGTLRGLHALYARHDWPAPTAPFIDMHDLGDMLVRAGFADPVMDQETLTLRWDSAEALLAELRGLGGNTAVDRIAGLRTPRWRDRLRAALDALREPDGRIGLGFEVAYGHAFKAAPRASVKASTSISLDDMRALIRTRPPAPASNSRRTSAASPMVRVGR